MTAQPVGEASSLTDLRHPLNLLSLLPNLKSPNMGTTGPKLGPVEYCHTFTDNPH
jgi:hypothetical protein